MKHNKTLQDAVANAKPGTKEQPTVIYLAPDVYWTDDIIQTGDTMHDMIFRLSALLFLIAGAGAAAVIYKRKKHNA